MTTPALEPSTSTPPTAGQLAADEFGTKLKAVQTLYMAIFAALKSGEITVVEARKRRRIVDASAKEFRGAITALRSLTRAKQSIEALKSQ